HRDLNYNSAYLTSPPSPLALDLLQVRWLIAPAGSPPPVAGATPMVREGGWALFELPDAAPRASLVGAWDVAGSADRALRATGMSGFDPSARVVLELDPG